MPDIRDDIKGSLHELGHSMADLCREAGINYKRLSGIVNGYWYARPEEDRKIRKTLEGWAVTTRAAERRCEEQTK